MRLKRNPVLLWGNDCIFVVIFQIYLRFLDYEMQNSNECKRNFVAVYDGSSSVGDLKAKFCSTVANDVMLRTGLGVIRMWADEGSRNSRFQMLFTSFQERKILCTLLFVLHLGHRLQGPSTANGVCPCSVSTLGCVSQVLIITEIPLPSFWPSDRRVTHDILITCFGAGIIALP